jgi:acetylornithine deacetylase
MAGQGHMPDEYIDLSQLAALDATLDRILAEITA